MGRTILHNMGRFTKITLIFSVGSLRNSNFGTQFLLDTMQLLHFMWSLLFQIKFKCSISSWTRIQCVHDRQVYGTRCSERKDRHQFIFKRIQYTVWNNLNFNGYNLKEISSKFKKKQKTFFLSFVCRVCFFSYLFFLFWYFFLSQFRPLIFLWWSIQESWC